MQQPKRCPSCLSSNVRYDGLAYGWFCQNPDCLWDGEESDLLEGDFLDGSNEIEVRHE